MTENLSTLFASNLGQVMGATDVSKDYGGMKLSRHNAAEENLKIVLNGDPAINN